MGDVIDKVQEFTERRFDRKAAAAFFELPEAHPAVEKLAVILAGAIVMDEVEDQVVILRSRAEQAERERDDARRAVRDALEEMERSLIHPVYAGSTRGALFVRLRQIAALAWGVEET